VIYAWWSTTPLRVHPHDLTAVPNRADRRAAQRRQVNRAGVRVATAALATRGRPAYAARRR
jgi:hypothetical protein